jgi:tRNA-dihydrouridine synthase
VPKVTRKGGGSALPWKTTLFRDIVAGAVAEASRGGIPVTVKMRLGIDDEHLTYLEAGRLAEAEGWPPLRCMPARHRSTTPGRPTGRRSHASRRP